ncbi:MAG: uroporphyrinogen-III C-methyltransferase [Xanthomonadales bacterium]|nr:uroporphyrinogen-III C-methyltransferase [Xanthomonadales bacterium]
MNESSPTDNDARNDAESAVDSSASSTAAEPTSAPASSTVPGKAKRGGAGRLLFWLFLLVLIGGAGWYGWQEIQRLQAENTDAVAARDDAVARIKALSQRIDRVEAANDELPSRIEQASSAALNPVSQQAKQANARLDAIDTERAALVERLRRSEERVAALQDQLAALGSARVQGRERLLLDQAEFLLLAGAERLRLTGDRDAALAAFRLAERAIGGLDDAQYAELRESVAGEIRRIQSLPADPRRDIAAALDAIDASLPTLPSRTAEVAIDSDSRLLRLMSRLVTVRRVDANDANAPLLDPLRRETAIAALSLDIGLARGAAARSDERAFRGAIARAHRAVERLYDAEQPDVAYTLARLDELSTRSLATPDITLGASLSALRLIRASNSEVSP